MGAVDFSLVLVAVHSRKQKYHCSFNGGVGSLRKAAPTNTAARLLRGDTLHALHKLPVTSLQGKRGKLSHRVLQRHQKRWATTRGHIFDEISGVPPANLYQVDVRTRSAKQAPHAVFGGLGTFLAGDFLQLPPVDKASLAAPLDDVGRMQLEDHEEAPDDNTPKKDEFVDFEHQGGCQLWRSVRTVVSLTLNMRTSGMLTRVLEEMRAGCSSDASWRALQDRVLGMVRWGDVLQKRSAQIMDHVWE